MAQVVQCFTCNRQSRGESLHSFGADLMASFAVLSVTSRSVRIFNQYGMISERCACLSVNFIHEVSFASVLWVRH